MNRRYLGREHQRRLATMLFEATVHLSPLNRQLVIGNFANELERNNEAQPEAYLSRMEDLLKESVDTPADP